MIGRMFLQGFRRPQYQSGPQDFELDELLYTPSARVQKKDDTTQKLITDFVQTSNVQKEKRLGEVFDWVIKLYRLKWITSPVEAKLNAANLLIWYAGHFSGNVVITRQFGSGLHVDKDFGMVGPHCHHPIFFFFL
jgi:hypothetical protein